MPAWSRIPLRNSSRLEPLGVFVSVNVELRPFTSPPGVSALTKVGNTTGAEQGPVVPSTKTQSPGLPTAVSICPFVSTTATAFIPNPGPLMGRALRSDTRLVTCDSVVAPPPVKPPADPPAEPDPLRTCATFSGVVLKGTVHVSV